VRRYVQPFNGERHRDAPPPERNYCIIPRTFPCLRSKLTELIENDPLFPGDVRIAGQKFLEEHKIEHEMKVYPGAPHGQ